MMLILHALLSVGHAETDPWGRPTHARVVIEPPSEIEDLYTEERRFRFWWDDIGVTATIEIRGRLRWRTLATDVPLGWTTEELPRNSVFRIRLSGGARTSNPLMAPKYYSPTDIAQISSTNPLLSNIVLDLDNNDTSDLWGAMYTGGLIQLSTQNDTTFFRTWTRWDGLPSDRVLSVSVDDDVTWVGTANGLAKIYDGQVLQLWDDVLSDSYVQSLDAHEGVVYVGTYQGLDRLVGQKVEHLLPHWSVFSILTDGSTTAVGYEGITFINKDDDINTQDWPGNVDALADIDGALWMATEHKGLVQSTSEGTSVILEDSINDILPREEDVWVAGEGTVWSFSKDNTDTLTEQLVGTGSMRALAEYDEKIWVGATGLHQLDLSLPKEDTDHHQQIPSVPFLTHASMIDILPLKNGLYYSHANTPLPQILGEVDSIFTPTNVFFNAQFHHGDHNNQPQMWLWSGQDLRQQNGTVEHQYTLEHPIIDMTDWIGQTWFADEIGLHKLNGDGTHTLEFELANIKELSSNRSTLWIRTTHSIHHATPSTVTEYATPSPVTAVAPSGLTVCVGTEDGLFRLWKGRDEIWENPLGMQDQNVKIIDTVGDGKGGCWIAAEDGSIGRIDVDGGSTWWHLPEPDPPTIHKLILDREQMWVLTEEGTWLLW